MEQGRIPLAQSGAGNDDYRRQFAHGDQDVVG